MATNPVSAFLQGFAAVDQLETNRQLRSFREEEMSRVRWRWKNEQDDRARFELKRYQAEKLTEVDAIAKGLMLTLPENDPLFRDELGFWNEVHKRLITGDAEFGEHVALALGLDPAVGPLVRDPTKPVSGIGVISPEQDPLGKGGVFIEIDSVNDKQPMTDNRTSAGNDRVTLTPLSMRELVRIYGKGILTNDFAVASQLRRLVGGEQATGNPTAAIDERQADTSVRKLPPPASTDTTAATELPASATATIEGVKFTSREEAEAARTAAVAGVQKQEPAIQEEVAAPIDNSQDPESDIVKFTGQESADQLADVIAEEIIPPKLERLGSAKDSVLNAFEAAAEALGIAGAATPQLMAASKERAINGFIDATYSFSNAIFDFFNTDTHLSREEDASVEARRVKAAAEKAAAEDKLAVEGPATKLTDISAPGNYSPSKLANNPDALIKAGNSAPLTTEQGAQQIATALLNAPKKPSLLNVYNAVVLGKTGMLTPAQIVNYAETGRFNATATRNLQIIQSGDAARIFDQDSGALSAPFSISGGRGGDTIKDRAAVRKEIEAQVKGEFILPDGSTNARALQQFMNATEEIFAMMGVPQGDARRTTDTFLNSLARGSRFVQRFDEDDIQFFDFKPGDFEVPYTAGNVVLGAMLSQKGVVGQKDASYGLREYLKFLKPSLPAMRINADDFLANAENLEGTVVARMNSKDYAGQSRDEIREEVVEEFIDRYTKR